MACMQRPLHCNVVHSTMIFHKNDPCYRQYFGNLMQVKPGDYCYIIATSYGLTVAALQGLNSGLKCDASSPVVGQILCVGTSCSTSPPAGCQCQYTVKPGDSCFKVASANGITVAQLQALNPSLNPPLTCDDNSPVIGQVLCLGTTCTSPPPAGCQCKYTVKAGDYCYKVATNFGITVAKLQALNPGLGCDDNSPKIGDVLCIIKDAPCSRGRGLRSGSQLSPDNPVQEVLHGPPTMTDALRPRATGAIKCATWYKTVRSDTCYALRKSFDISRADFAQLNPGVLCPVPGEDMKLCVAAAKPVPSVEGESCNVPYARVVRWVELSVTRRNTVTVGNLDKAGSSLVVPTQHACSRHVTPWWPQTR